MPVWNVEKYIKDSLESIKNQTEKDYEVIVIDDGTEDQSIEIAKQYDVKIIHQKNQGQSAARNRGIKEAKGDYLIFVDSDDTIEKDLLKKIKESLTDDPDVVRFQVRTTYPEKDSVDYPEEGFDTCRGDKAFEKLCKYRFVEAVCLYAVKREFYQREHFLFKEGMLHEDFRLIPLLIMKAEKVKSISYIGYNYLQRENSTMNSTSYEKTKKKADDFLKHYLYLMEESNKLEGDTKIFQSYIANSLISKATELKGKDYQEYRKVLKQENVYNYILTDTLPRKIKKVILKLSPKLYYKIK